jgi:hypothetical protein
MRKLVIYLFALLLTSQPLLMFGQIGSARLSVLIEERARLLDHINITMNDSDVASKLTRLVENNVDSIYKYIAGTSLSDIEQEKAIRSLVYFMEEMREKTSRQRLDLYDIPGAFESYEKVLHALLSRQPIAAFIAPLSSRRSQLLATAFSQYEEFNLLSDMAIYKRVASAPDFILRFLEDKPGFRYTDSLLLIAAAHDPIKFAAHFRQSKTRLNEKVQHIDNIYFRQIVSLSGNKSASELLPFVIQLAEKKITPDTILKTRMQVTRYFQLLVNTMIASKASNDPALFQKMLRDGIKKKSLTFYVNQVNELHNSKEAVRFASVKGLRPEDLYYIITTAGDELYTSSYLGLYKRLMQHFKKQSADSLFQIVHYDNFRAFMRLAANYNTLPDFLTNMPAENSAALLKRFIGGIESDPETGLEKAMDIADCFTGLDSSVHIVAMIDDELQGNLKRCQSNQQYFGSRLYNILLQVFSLVQQQGSFNKLWSTLGNYEILKLDALKNKNGEIVEMALFYGDEDGIASFNNFQKQFANKNWEITKNHSWITIRSLSEQPIVIYANLPLNNDEELDLNAQDSLNMFLEQQAIEPTVLIHRGHSYHLSNTLKRLTPAIKLAILGSCGAYNSVISIASINADVQIIGSKKMGSKSVNDPVIDMINETLQNGQDLLWPEVWQKLQEKFRKDEFTRNLFNEYIPPGKNVSLFVLKLFNFYNNIPQLAYSATGTSN